MKKLLFPLFILCNTFLSLAQQDPQYTQYTYNMNVINPAYVTGDTGHIELGALYRRQWTNVEGAPETITLFGHASLRRNIDLGLTVVNDQIGNDITETNVNGDFAYRFNLSENLRLSLGTKLGFTVYNADFSNLTLDSGGSNTDPAFANVNSTFLNVGAGAFLYSRNFYLGLSAPNLIPSKHLENTAATTFEGREDIHYYLTSGYVFRLNPDLKFKPSVLLKTAAGAPITTDIAASFLMRNKLELGVSYRIEDAVSALFSYKISPNFRVGYAYDYTLSDLNEFSQGSHEIFLTYSFEVRSLTDCFPNRFF
ncbi:PorP/SprF family type IX secretion system membrane protein [Aquimarina rhabdastrellae]